jgi:hypothetical protein
LPENRRVERKKKGCGRRERIGFIRKYVALVSRRGGGEVVCRKSLNVDERSDAVDPFRLSALPMYKPAIRTFRIIGKHVIATVLEPQNRRTGDKTVHSNQNDSRASYVIQKSRITLPSSTGTGKRVVQLVQILQGA